VKICHIVILCFKLEYAFPRATWERGGLAAIGGTVGGGMAAGTVVVAAAPVAAATAVGYGIYKFAKWLKDD